MLRRCVYYRPATTGNAREPFREPSRAYIPPATRVTPAVQRATARVRAVPAQQLATASRSLFDVVLWHYGSLRTTVTAVNTFHRRLSRQQPACLPRFSTLFCRIYLCLRAVAFVLPCHHARSGVLYHHHALPRPCIPRTACLASPITPRACRRAAHLPFLPPHTLPTSRHAPLFLPVLTHLTLCCRCPLLLLLLPPTPPPIRTHMPYPFPTTCADIPSCKTVLGAAPSTHFLFVFCGLPASSWPARAAFHKYFSGRCWFCWWLGRVGVHALPPRLPRRALLPTLQTDRTDRTRAFWKVGLEQTRGDGGGGDARTGRGRGAGGRRRGGRRGGRTACTCHPSTCLYRISYRFRARLRTRTRCLLRYPPPLPARLLPHTLRHLPVHALPSFAHAYMRFLRFAALRTARCAIAPRALWRCGAAFLPTTCRATYIWFTYFCTAIRRTFCRLRALPFSPR